jgi:hypothetical protein
MKKLAFFLLLIFTASIAQEDFSSLIRNIQKNYNETHYSKWQIIPIAEYPVDSMKTKRVPDLSRGKIWIKDQLGGIVWYDKDTSCVVIKTWNSKGDTTFKFLWFKKTAKGWK